MSLNCQLSDADAVFVLYFGHDEGALPRGEAFDGAEGVEHEVLVAFHVVHLYLEQVVEAAGDVVALGDLGYLVDLGDEIVDDVAVDAFELHVAIDDETLIEFIDIEHGCVFLDVAFAFEALHALVHGRRRKMYFVGQFLDGQSGVGLQDTHDLQIDGI